MQAIATVNEPRTTFFAYARSARNAELLRDVLAHDGHAVAVLRELTCLDELPRDPAERRVAFVDVTGGDATLWERCASLRSRGIEWIAILPASHELARRRAVGSGATLVLTKPLRMAEIRGLAARFSGASE